MAKKETLIQKIKKDPLPWVIQIVGIGVLVLNLWLASKLSPMAKDLAVIQTQVLANTESQKEFVRKDSLEATLKGFGSSLTEINNRLGAIEGVLLTK